MIDMNFEIEREIEALGLTDFFKETGFLKVTLLSTDEIDHLKSCIFEMSRKFSTIKKELTGEKAWKIDIFQHKTKLLAFLSEVAIPSCVIQLDEIPKLTNGKINYHKLSERVKHDKSLLCGA